MRKIQGTILTTHVDSHGEKFAAEGLEPFVNSINNNYLPFTIEHDIRNVPIGRVTSATIERLEDGEFAVKGTFEIFEEGDTELSLRGDGRKLLIKYHDIPTFNVGYDDSYETPEGRELLAALSRLSSECCLIVQAKKSVEPISTLTIIVAAGSAIVGGFLAKLGSDLYVDLKKVLKSYFGSPRRKSPESLLDFQITTIRNGERAEIHVVLTNPTPEEIEALFSYGFGTLDSYLSNYDGLNSVGRFVFQFKDGKLESLYVLREDCVPLKLRRASKG